MVVSFKYIRATVSWSQNQTYRVPKRTARSVSFENEVWSLGKDHREFDDVRIKRVTWLSVEINTNVNNS